jgi:hypothetical protein
MSGVDNRQLTVGKIRAMVEPLFVKVALLLGLGLKRLSQEFTICINSDCLNQDLQDLGFTGLA